MAQTALMLQTLKACLKAERKTYKDVAHALDLSEASVKRLFAEQDLSLARLDAICQLAGLEISDLVQKMDDGRRRLESLTAQQEREITEDLTLLLVMVCAFNHWTLAQITEFYSISESECTGKLLRLDQLKILDLLPGNRIKLRISQNFKWLKNGPIEQFFRATIGKEFFDSTPRNDSESLLVLNGMLSRRSSAELQRKIEKLAHDFDALSQHDAGLPFQERHGVTLVLAARNWNYGLFHHMRRELEIGN